MDYITFFPDITKCDGYDCKIKNNCVRFLSQSREYQSYFISNPNKEGNCDFFWSIDDNGK